MIILCLLDNEEITQVKSNIKAEDCISSERPFYYPRIITLHRKLQNLISGSTMTSDVPCVELDDKDKNEKNCKTKSKSSTCYKELRLDLPRKLKNLVDGSIMTSDVPCFSSNNQGMTYMKIKISAKLIIINQKCMWKNS